MLPIKRWHAPAYHSTDAFQFNSRASKDDNYWSRVKETTIKRDTGVWTTIFEFLGSETSHMQIPWLPTASSIINSTQERHEQRFAGVTAIVLQQLLWHYLSPTYYVMLLAIHIPIIPGHTWTLSVASHNQTHGLLAKSGSRSIHLVSMIVPKLH